MPPTTMGTKDGKAPTRNRGRPSLPVSKVMVAALAIVDDGGPAALSMRALAQRLGSGTATLYRHFEDRQTLVAGLVDWVLGTIDLDSGHQSDADWRRALRMLAETMFDVLSRHGGLVQLLIGALPNGPNARRHRERCIALLMDAGFEAGESAKIYATIAHYVLGAAIQLAPADPAPDGGGSPFGGLDRTLYPATAAALDAGFLPISPRDEFAFGLDLMIRGIPQPVERR